MTRMPEIIKNPPCWLVYSAGFALLALLAGIDYLTGEYSMLVFYLVPVALVAWFRGKWGGLLFSFLSGCARFVADFSTYDYSLVHFWNALADVAFLLIVSVLVAIVRRLLERDQRRYQP